MDRRNIASLFNEFIENSSNCIETMSQNRELKQVNNELKKLMIKRDNEGLKKFRVASNDELEMINDELNRKSDELGRMDVNRIINNVDKVSENEIKVFVFSDGQKEEISTELVRKYPESLLNVNMLDIDSRNNDHEIEIDFRLKYLKEILKYMGNEYNIDDLNGVEFDEFCRELMEMRIPFRMDIMNRLYTGSNEYGVGWKNRCVMIKKQSYKLLDFGLFNVKLNDLKYNNEQDQVVYMIKNTYASIIQSFSNYLQDKSKSAELCSTIDRFQLNSFLSDYSLDMNHSDVQSFLYPLYSPFLKESILAEQQYDNVLKEWVGDYSWKLIYRASQHRYTAKSFHEYCGVQRPTLVLIKSSEGWIFGGYTTRCWRVNCWGTYHC